MTWSRQIQLFSRKVIAFAVACNFLIALIFSVQAHAGHQVSSDSYGLAPADQLIQVTCLKQVEGHSGAPIEHSNNPGCILFCLVNTLNFYSLGFALLGLAILIFKPRAGYFHKKNLDGSFASPIDYGWGSSWVAHGPPSLLVK